MGLSPVTQRETVSQRQKSHEKRKRRRDQEIDINVCKKGQLSKFHVIELIATSPWLQASSVVLPYINSSVGFQAALECASAISDMSLPSFRSNMRRKYPDIRTDSQLQLLSTL